MIESEKLFPLQAAYELETGHRPSPATVHRHRLRGPVRLETVRLGGRRMTSREAVRRFIAGRTALADGTGTPSTPNRSARRRDAVVDSAERALIELGA
jgi:hypothetical protein